MSLILLLVFILILYSFKKILESKNRGVMTIRRTIFWILSFTWGALISLPGALVALALILLKHKPEKVGPFLCFRIGKSWGGLSLGPVMLVSKTSQQSCILHEAGHGIQNIIWGPLYLFLIFIPSSLRYWVREFNQDVRVKLSVSICATFLCLIDILLITFACVSESIIWWVILVIASVYSVALCSWIILKEVPKYKYGLTPYNSIWFEGQATEFGYRYFDNNKLNNYLRR